MLCWLLSVPAPWATYRVCSLLCRALGANSCVLGTGSFAVPLQDVVQHTAMPGSRIPSGGRRGNSVYHLKSSAESVLLGVKEAVLAGKAAHTSHSKGFEASF